MAAGFGKSLPITAWVRISPDNRVTILNPVAEMGQGSMTALPLILADEMDADWGLVDVEYAPALPDIYGKMLGRSPRRIMITVGSRAVMDYFLRLRQAGAQVRQILLQSAAAKWGVSVSELTTEPNEVVHAASSRRLTYGDIAAFAEVPSELPEIPEVDLKRSDEFRYIGQSIPRIDVPSKVDGSAEFSIDIQLPNMLFAMVKHAPVHGRQPVAFNGEDVKALPGVVDVISLRAPEKRSRNPFLSPFVAGVAVIGESIGQVMSARDQLEVDWTEGAQAADFDSEQALDDYARIAEDQDAEANVIFQRGDVDEALAQATKTYTADYLNDHLYHAQIEPLNAVAAFNDREGSLEVWAGTQSVSRLLADLTVNLQLKQSNIKLNRCYLGGGFGRRSASDNVVQAALLSRAVARPVKLIWSREDDLLSGQFRPMGLQRMEAGVDADGTITGWKHTIVGDGGDGVINLLAQAIGTPFYAMPNQKLEARPTHNGVKLKHWRAVAHGINKFAIESFIDELAADQKIDPYAYRGRLTRDAPRARAVLDLVATMADWGTTRPEGRALGIALAERSESLAAGVAKVSVNRETGIIRVHRFWAAVDAGIIVQPANATAQIEGSIIFALSGALRERITFKKGQVQQTNFHNYEVMRFRDVPELIEVRFVPSAEAPTGVGEPGVPITAPAVANAVFALTGVRLRHMPFTPDRVLAVLK